MSSIARSLCCLLLWCAPWLALAQSAPMPGPDAFVVGEAWEWRRLDALTKLEESRWIRTVVKSDAGLALAGEGTADPIAKIYEHGSYLPSAKPWRVWPLAVGKRWDFEAGWTRADGTTGSSEQKAEVAAFEEVTVPAGTFMAYRLEYRGYFRNSRGNSGRQDDTYWYAPDVKATVKHVRSSGRPVSVTELTSYKKPAP